MKGLSTTDGVAENRIAAIVVDTALKIHRTLGPGLLESVYEIILIHELKKQGLRVERQKLIPVVWDGLTIDEGFRADVVIDNTVILELKSVDTLSPVACKQLLTYLKLTGMHLGLVINFGEELLKNGIFRVANDMPKDR